MNSISSNIVWQQTRIPREQRERQNKHSSCVLWFTVLSCSEKSTLAQAADEALNKIGCYR